MAYFQPIQGIETLSLNSDIKEQSLKWDAEKHLHDFRSELDSLDLMSDALPDDPRIANALIGLHDRLSNIYAEFKAQLQPH